MAELWKECAQWLARLEVLPSDHRVLLPSAEVLDLAYTLRDGVLLCHTINALEPDGVDMKDINQRPQMAQFLCLKNIRIFLHSCKQIFDLKDTDLFEAFMLYDYTDFAKVLHTLSKLSNCAKAHRRGIIGFPLSRRTAYDDEIYKNLEDLANEDLYEEFQYDRYGSSGHCGYREDYYSMVEKEDIYEDLFSFGKQLIPKIPELTQPVEKRDYCIRELVETEKKYIEVLNMINKHFIRPLANIIKEEDRNILFMCIKELVEIHTGFHSELCKACSANPTCRLNDVFIRWKEKFLIYGNYCSNLPRSQFLIDELCSKNERINQEVMKCQQEANDGRFKLRDLLAVPMQRILKYHLLLKELKRNTQPTHADYESLDRAYEAMLDVADFINETKRDNETLQIIRDIQRSISDWNMSEKIELKECGRLIKDGELKIQSHDDNRIKLRYIFIFDTILLMCKSTRGEQYSFKYSLKIQDYKIQDISSRKMMTKDTRWGYSWLYVHKGKLNAYTMFAKTEDAKKKWIKALRDALDNVQPEDTNHTNHKFEMHTVIQPTSCETCGKLLKGIYFQCYKCTVCGVCVHKKCIVLTHRCGLQAPVPPPRPSSPRPITPSSSSPEPWVLFSPQDQMWAMELRDGSFSQDHIESRLTVKHSSAVSVAINPSTVPANNLEYVNLVELEQHSWYVGEMAREIAEAMLEDMPNGTFLLRIGIPKRGVNGEDRPGGAAAGYRLSLKTSNEVKHMILRCEKHSSMGYRFCLSPSRYFGSIVEVVNWYEKHSLRECFKGLDYTLKWPVKELTIAVVQYDYEPEESTSNLLTLRKGEKVVVISKDEDGCGWWKGQIGEQIGYFYKTYVKEEME